MRTCDIEHCEGEARHTLRLSRWTWYGSDTEIRRWLCDVHSKRALEVLRDQFDLVFEVTNK